MSDDSICLQDAIPKGKVSLEDLHKARDELKDLITQVKNEKKNHNFRTLKDIANSLELITTKLEKLDSKFNELQRGQRK